MRYTVLYRANAVHRAILIPNEYATKLGPENDHHRWLTQSSAIDFQLAGCIQMGSTGYTPSTPLVKVVWNAWIAWLLWQIFSVFKFSDVTVLTHCATCLTLRSIKTMVSPGSFESWHLVLCNLQINGQNMTDKTQNDAVELLRNTPLGGTVLLVVCRQLMEQQPAQPAAVQVYWLFFFWVWLPLSECNPAPYSVSVSSFRQ